METLVIVALVGSVVALAAVGFAMEREKRRRATWIGVAQRLGLKSNGDEIVGELDGIEVRAWFEVRRSGKHRHSFMLYAATVGGEAPIGLDLWKEGFFSKIGKLLGMDDIQLDLPGLDEKLIVRGPDPDAIRRWASRADVSRALVELAAGPWFEVENGKLTWEFRGKEFDGAQLEARLHEIVRLAKALSGGGLGALLDDGVW